MWTIQGEGKVIITVKGYDASLDSLNYSIYEKGLANTPSLFSLISSSLMRPESASLASGGAVSELVLSNSPFVLSVDVQLSFPHLGTSSCPLCTVHPGTSAALYVPNWTSRRHLQKFPINSLASHILGRHFPLCTQ